jgi:hypothetical protein
MTREQVISLIKDRLNGYVFLAQLNQALDTLGPIEGWTSQPLNAVADANEPYTLPPGCTKSTLAARQDASMFIDGKLATKISDGQLGLLIIHEAAFYFAEKTKCIQTSEKIRTFMTEILKVNLDKSKLENAIRDLGGAVTYYDVVNNATYATFNYPSSRNPGGPEIMHTYSSILDNGEIRIPTMTLQLEDWRTDIEAPGANCDSSGNNCQQYVAGTGNTGTTWSFSPAGDKIILLNPWGTLIGGRFVFTKQANACVNP